ATTTAILVVDHFDRVPAVALFVTLVGMAAAIVRFGVLFREVHLLSSVRRLALTDDLTGLANRRRLAAFLDARVAEARASHAQPALLMLDLNRFKEVNDTLGHSSGDLLLRGVAARLEGALQDADLLARLGGDEFAIVLSPGAGQAALE